MIVLIVPVGSLTATSLALDPAVTNCVHVESDEDFRHVELRVQTRNTQRRKDLCTVVAARALDAVIAEITTTGAEWVEVSLEEDWGDLQIVCFSGDGRKRHFTTISVGDELKDREAKLQAK